MAEMQYRPLGRSGLRVSPICLGVLQFGAAATPADAAAMIDSARAAGVNFLDVANVYALGEAERALGPLIARDRDSWVLATKAGIAMGPGPHRGGLSRKHLFDALDDSLRRLGTDYVDIFYLHVPDEETPLAETLRAVDDIIRSGKARYFGISNYRAFEIADIALTCDRMGIARPVVCQMLYNLVDREAEREIIPACHQFGIAVAPYSPLARGVLTGKYTVNAPLPEGSRAARKDRRLIEAELRDESILFAAQMAERAKARGLTPSQFAIAWMLRNRLLTSVVTGPRTLAQWEDNLSAATVTLTAEDEAFVNAIVPPGWGSTPQFNDPLWPPLGREAAAGERIRPAKALPPGPKA